VTNKNSSAHNWPPDERPSRQRIDLLNSIVFACNCSTVRSAARHVSQFYDHFLASAGLRITQLSILAQLKRFGPLNINALAKHMVMDRTTAARNIRPLEKEGLIRIGSIASDLRAKELCLTSAGEKRLQAGLKTWAQAQALFESSFGAKRSADLRALMRAIVANAFIPEDRLAD
jgi:DNA-binding MarR family transcriptional regulator